MFIVAIFRNLGQKFHFITLILLYVCDVLSLLVLILFRIAGYWNYAKLTLLFVITPFIVIVHFYLKRFSEYYQFSPSDQSEPIARPTNY